MEMKRKIYIKPEEAVPYMHTHTGLLGRKKMVAAICMDENNVSCIKLAHAKNKGYMMEVMDNFQAISQFAGNPEMIAGKMPEYIDLLIKLHGEEEKQNAGMLN